MSHKIVCLSCGRVTVKPTHYRCYWCGSDDTGEL